MCDTFFSAMSEQHTSSAPLVSVCIQTYRHAPYIEQCLQGALMQQTTFPYEIVVGEDESDDGTREICKDYAERYPEKIRLFLRSRKDVMYRDGKPTGRFNFLENLRAAQGKYIAMLDGDDFWIDSLKLQKQVQFLEQNSEYAICAHSCLVQKNNQFTTERSRKKRYSQDDFLRKYPFVTCTVVFRKQPYEEMAAWASQCAMGDWPLLMCVAGKGDIYIMPDTMAVYRIHAGGVNSSKTSMQRLQALMNALSFFHTKLPEKKWVIFTAIIRVQLRYRIRSVVERIAKLRTSAE